MTPFEAFQLFNSIKLHFISETYDYFKYNGKIKTTLRGFQQRKDKFFYTKLAKHPDIKKFVLANMIDGDPAKWIGSIMKDEQAEQIYHNWIRRQQSLSYIVGSQCALLKDDFNGSFQVWEGQNPPLLKLFLSNKICLETMVVLEDLVHYCYKWNLTISDKIRWPTIEFRIRKYRSFLDYDKDKMKKIIIEKVT